MSLEQALPNIKQFYSSRLNQNVPNCAINSTQLSE